MFGLMVCFITFGVVSLYEPYEEAMDNRIARLCQVHSPSRLQLLGTPTLTPFSPLPSRWRSSLYCSPPLDSTASTTPPQPPHQQSCAWLSLVKSFSAVRPPLYCELGRGKSTLISICLRRDMLHFMFPCAYNLHLCIFVSVNVHLCATQGCSPVHFIPGAGPRRSFCLPFRAA